MFQKIIKILTTLIIFLIMTVQVTVGKYVSRNWTKIYQCNTLLPWFLFISVIAGFFFFLVQLIAQFCILNKNQNDEEAYKIHLQDDEEYDQIEESLGRRVLIFYTIILLVFKLFWNSFTILEYHKWNKCLVNKNGYITAYITLLWITQVLSILLFIGQAWFYAQHRRFYNIFNDRKSRRSFNKYKEDEDENGFYNRIDYNYNSEKLLESGFGTTNDQLISYIDTREDASVDIRSSIMPTSQAF